MNFNACMYYYLRASGGGINSTTSFVLLNHSQNTANRFAAFLASISILNIKNLCSNSLALRNVKSGNPRPRFAPIVGNSKVANARFEMFGEKDFFHCKSPTSVCPHNSPSGVIAVICTNSAGTFDDKFETNRFSCAVVFAFNGSLSTASEYSLVLLEMSFPKKRKSFVRNISFLPQPSKTENESSGFGVGSGFWGHHTRQEIAKVIRQDGKNQHSQTRRSFLSVSISGVSSCQIAKTPATRQHIPIQ